jgi:hypothetical protein
MPFLSTPSRTSHHHTTHAARQRRVNATGIGGLFPCVVLAAAVATFVVAPPAAHAQADERDIQARAHYESGVQLFDAGNYEGAYRQFEAGHHLSGRPKFLVSMAHAQRRRGQLLEAVRLYQQYLSLVSDSPLQAQVKREVRRLEAALDEQRRRQHPKRAGDLAAYANAENKDDNKDNSSADTDASATASNRISLNAPAERRSRTRGRADTSEAKAVAAEAVPSSEPRAPARTITLAVSPVSPSANTPLSPAALAKTVTAQETKPDDVLIDASDDKPIEQVRRPYYKRPWFWVAVAAGVVATGAVAAVQLVPRPLDNSPRSQVIGTLGGPVE